MFTYRATYRLSAVADSADGRRTWKASVSMLIKDMSLHHAAARAEWHRTVVATQEGWAPGRTELVSVTLVGGDVEAAEERAMGVALRLVGCPEHARQLVVAAAAVNSGQ